MHETAILSLEVSLRATTSEDSLGMVKSRPPEIRGSFFCKKEKLSKYKKWPKSLSSNLYLITKKIPQIKSLKPWTRNYPIYCLKKTKLTTKSLMEYLTLIIHPYYLCNPKFLSILNIFTKKENQNHNKPTSNNDSFHSPVNRA